MGGFDAVRDIGAQQGAEDGKDGHDGEDDLVAVDALMAIEDGAVDGVHEGAGQMKEAMDMAEPVISRGTSTSSMGAKKTARML